MSVSHTCHSSRTRFESDPRSLKSLRSETLHILWDATTKGVPDKGKILTKISLFWFEKLKNITPTHFVTANIDDMPEEVKQYKDQLDGRAMLVKRAKVIALEAIVRGYLTGKEGRI